MKKIIAITLSILMLMVCLTACGGKEEKSVSTDGSTSMQKVMLALGEAFMENNSGTNFTYNGTGFEAKGFPGGSPMFEALKTEMPELIVLDIMMPGDDGITILKKLRSNPSTKDVPIIMATAKGTEMDMITGLDTGADDYLVKPFNLNLDTPTVAQAYDELSPLLHRIDKQNKQISIQLAQLKEKTDQIEQTTASMNEGLVLLDAEGKILSINPAAAKLFEPSSACVGFDFLNLINDVIRLSQLDEGGEFPQESVDLYAIASQVLQTLLPAADRRNITVELLGEHTIITGVRQLAYELIYNLCDNAIRYNKDGGLVTVTIGKDSVTVKDTGIGISKEHQARIFERFYRVDKSHSRETGGTGLGLSIAKHAAQRLGVRNAVKAFY